MQVTTSSGIEGTEGADLSVVTSEEVWRGVMTRSLDPRAAVSSGRLSVSPDLKMLAKFFTFFDF